MKIEPFVSGGAAAKDTSAGGSDVGTYKVSKSTVQEVEVWYNGGIKVFGIGLTSGMKTGEGIRGEAAIEAFEPGWYRAWFVTRSSGEPALVPLVWRE